MHIFKSYNLYKTLGLTNAAEKMGMVSMILLQETAPGKFQLQKTVLARASLLVLVKQPVL